jgi:predicted phosphodiesterase
VNGCRLPRFEIDSRNCDFDLVRILAPVDKIPSLMPRTRSTPPKFLTNHVRLQEPPRKYVKGLAFSSSSQKRKQEDGDSDSIPPVKRHRLDQEGANYSAGDFVKTRFLILSDTHGKSRFPQRLPEDLSVDAVLHCGDLSECGDLEDYRNTISLLSSVSAPLKLVIAGNHDLTLDGDFWSKNSSASGADLHQQARELWTGKEAKDAGIMFLEDGFHEFALKSGATLRVYASAATPNNFGIPEWAFGYPSVEDRYNPQGKGVFYGRCSATPQTEIADELEIDIMMTHGPPKYKLDRTAGMGDSIGCPHLFRAVRRSRPKVHVFGHVHKSYGAEMVDWSSNAEEELPGDDDGEHDGIRDRSTMIGQVDSGVRRLEVKGLDTAQQTVFVNAALMGHDQELRDLPWLLEMNLKVS